MNIPKHVAIIMDGNGRWAKAKNLPRNAGHVAGAKNVEAMCEWAYNAGVKYLTVYAFSTENWSRPKAEVDALMKLLRNYMKNAIKRAMKNDMRVRVIGDLAALAEDLQEAIGNLVETTKDNTGLNFTIAINYGARDEMLRAMRKMNVDLMRAFTQEQSGAQALDVLAEQTVKAIAEDGSISGQSHRNVEAFSDYFKTRLTSDLFSSYLDTADMPDPDLLIRTSGELRLSNFLLWQMAYTEFYFADVHWPAFDEEQLHKALAFYASRDRRFGKVEET